MASPVLVLCPRGPLTWAWLDLGTGTGRAKLPGAGKHASQEPSWPRGKGTPGSLSLWTGVICWGEGMVWSSGHPSSAGLTERQEGPRRARPGDREGWPEAQRGGAGGHRPGARGPLGPLSGHNVLDYSTAWLADREQWLAEASGSQPSVGEQPGPSKGWFLQPVLPPWARSGPAYLGGRQGAWRPVGTSAIPPYTGP